MTRFIFITGGVVSSLGKGVASASIGAILEARGLSVCLTKLDPYINVDPGTMSPHQHGEVYVTSDGAETDLDMGYYERFVHFKSSKLNNYTTGQIYENVIYKERRGDYLGGTVQVIPHITNEIKAVIKASAGDAEIALIEIGGTVGDIESLPFLEAIRQMAIEQETRDKTAFVHLTLIPYVGGSREFKTKPTQHSVKELRSIGIQPDILLCRTGRYLTDEERNKIALFTNVDVQAVISAIDVDNIYKIPLLLHEQDVDQFLIKKLRLKTEAADLSDWEQVVADYERCQESIQVAIVGKYVQSHDAYKSIHTALADAGAKKGLQVDIKYVDSEIIEAEGTEVLSDVDAILIPGGFGNRGIEGKITAAEYARTNKIPYLGICLGMQVAVIEFARHIANLLLANSTEFNPHTEYPVIALITEWQDESGVVEHRDEHSDLGGTMRLGEQSTRLVEDSLIYSLYKKDIITERHRHRYEFNDCYVKTLTDSGLRMTGKSADGRLVEVIEIDDHPWFVGCQFHPEFNSTPRAGHPLFIGFVCAAKQCKEEASSARLDEDEEEASSTRLNEDEEASSTRLDEDEEASSTRLDEDEEASSTRLDEDEEASSTRL